MWQSQQACNLCSWRGLSCRLELAGQLRQQCTLGFLWPHALETELITGLLHSPQEALCSDFSLTLVSLDGLLVTNFRDLGVWNAHMTGLKSHPQGQLYISWKAALCKKKETVCFYLGFDLGSRTASTSGSFQLPSFPPAGHIVRRGCWRVGTPLSPVQAFFPMLYRPGWGWGNAATHHFLPLPRNLLLNLFILFLGLNNSFSHYRFYCSPGAFLEVDSKLFILKMYRCKCDEWFRLEPWLLSCSPQIGRAGALGRQRAGWSRSSELSVMALLLSMALRLKKFPAKLSLAGYVLATRILWAAFSRQTEKSDPCNPACFPFGLIF